MAAKKLLVAYTARICDDVPYDCTWADAGTRAYNNVGDFLGNVGGSNAWVWTYGPDVWYWEPLVDVAVLNNRTQTLYVKVIRAGGGNAPAAVHKPVPRNRKALSNKDIRFSDLFPKMKVEYANAYFSKGINSPGNQREADTLQQYLTLRIEPWRCDVCRVALDQVQTAQRQHAPLIDSVTEKALHIKTAMAICTVAQLQPLGKTATPQAHISREPDLCNPMETDDFSPNQQVIGTRPAGFVSEQQQALQAPSKQGTTQVDAPAGGSGAAYSASPAQADRRNLDIRCTNHLYADTISVDGDDLLVNDSADIAEAAAAACKPAVLHLLHEAWYKAGGLLHGCIEVGLTAQLSGCKPYMIGAMVMADTGTLNTSEALHFKLNQTAKEAFAIWQRNASRYGHFGNVSMLLSDGNRHMRMDFECTNINSMQQLKTRKAYTSIEGSVKVSAPFSVDGSIQPGLGCDPYTGMAILLSWIFRDHDMHTFTPEALKAAADAGYDKACEVSCNSLEELDARRKVYVKDPEAAKLVYTTY